jgi:hypothetical protein
MALYIKVVLAFLIYCDGLVLPISRVLGPGWHFLVPCIIGMRLDGRGLTVGDYMLRALENTLPRRLFPSLGPLRVKKDAGTVEMMVCA